MNYKLPTMGDRLRVIIIGASGGIGKALVKNLDNSVQVDKIYALSRYPEKSTSNKIITEKLDLSNEDSIQSTSSKLLTTGKFDLCIIATGLLQDKEMTPEKNMKSLKTSSFNKSFLINTIGPALVAKYFIPLLRNDKKAVLAAISARVGSISDNKIGGWYAYRASKAALNMVIKCLSIEVSRKSKNQIILGLHPGTVDTNLSKPFQKNVPKEKLFSPDFSALKLLNVINEATVNESGSLLAWDGSVISF
jgi:NAD(P)-dependent dehydrogenase (short-subunit alcohol dehydrogenase family)